MKREIVKFESEAALCDAFIQWAKPQGWLCYAETCGWDILLVEQKTGVQIGVQAKLRLNGKVLSQARELADWSIEGPHHRAVLVPQGGDLAFVPKLLGILVFEVDTYRTKAYGHRMSDEERKRIEFHPMLTNQHYGECWHDWHPTKPHELPEHVPDVAAGVPAPIQLTKWKIAALKVLALLERQGFLTRKCIRECGIDPQRWCGPDGWLVPGEGPGRFVRGDRLPAFEKQHPEVYAAILAKTPTPLVAPL